MQSRLGTMPVTFPGVCLQAAASLRRLAAAVLLGVASMAPLAAHAQAPADSARPLPPVEVVSSVLPWAAGTTGSGVPARTTRLDAATLLRLAPRSLAGALASQPGASLYDDLGSAYKQTLVMRGFTASGVVGLPQGVSVFVDGVPVNEPDAGQVNFELLPLQHARQVEVFSGTASLLGPNSLAGAVNLVTNRGGGPRVGELAVGAGTHGRQSVSGNAQGEAAGWSYYGGADLARERGWRTLTAARLGNVFVNAGRLGESAGVGLQVNAATSYAETAGSLPRSVYDVQPDSNLSAGDFEHLRQLHVALFGYTAALGGRGSATVYARAHDAERFNVNQVADPDVRGFSRNRSAGSRADWTRPLARGASDATLRAGFGGSIHHTGIRLFAERIDAGLTTDVESPIRKADAYATADYQRARVTLAGGMRFDIVHIPFRNLLRPERDTTSTYRHVSPRLGIGIALGRGATAFASAGRSFRAPAVIELACADPEEPCPLPFALGDDPPLAPVVATTLETGVRWNTAGWAVDAAVYRTNVRDDIFLFPYHDEHEPEGSTIDGFFANLPLTRREGVELTARGDLRGGHSVHAAYGFTRATFQSGAEIFSIREAAGAENDVEPGDRLPLVPDHSASAGVSIRVRPSLAAGGEVRYTGRRWLRGDEANETAPLAGFTTLALHASAILGRWTIDASLTNALDARYASFATFNINQGAGDALEQFLTPGARRALQLRLRRVIGG